MINVILGILAEPVLCLGNQRIAIAEFGCARWAGFSTGCVAALLHPVRTHNALTHAWVQCSPLVLRLRKRAGNHAIAAANALVNVVHHWAFRRLMERTDGAHRSAGRLIAMHTKP